MFPPGGVTRRGNLADNRGNGAVRNGRRKAAGSSELAGEAVLGIVAPKFWSVAKQRGAKWKNEPRKTAKCEKPDPNGC